MDLLNSLPNEILLEIFEYCKILPLTLVCKKFNKIVSGSTKLMGNLNLTIVVREFSKLLITSSRNHQSVSFKFNYKIDEACLPVFDTFKEIKSLELTRCIVSAEVFTEILNRLPQLEKLSIYSSHLKDKSYLDQSDAPRLAKLKRLNFRNSDAAFLLLLKGSSIETLSAAVPALNIHLDFGNFLRSQTRIRNIEYLNTLGHDETLITVITKDLPNLEKIHIEASSMNVFILRNLEVTNSSVRQLCFLGTPNTAAALNQTINIFKGLKALEIEMNNLLEPEVLLQLQQQRPNLESLSIKRCYTNFFNHIQFRNLKELRLTDGNVHPEDWLRLASRNPSIETLIIKDEAITNELFRIICLEFRRLRHFETNFDSERLTPEILDFIFDPAFPSNIRILKIEHDPPLTRTFFNLTDQHKVALNANRGFQCVFH